MPARGPTAPPPRLARVKASGEIDGPPADPAAPVIAGGFGNDAGIGLDKVGVELIVSAGIIAPSPGAPAPSGLGADVPAAIGLGVDARTPSR